ncbi:protein vav isoform X7 [Octopus sinensis]|uniref:Protein vav isoform X7 n=1 Tax=Octopus sinensis TaxID=2607531 RepID=A0A6P7TFC6_9MOLL|nr:protein vav isoform X7 [Octopus sinensis]
MAGQEDWCMCVQWLVRCQVLPKEHRANSPQAQIFDLAQALRDGVIICHLLNHLNPACLDLKDFSQRPQMSQFLCLKNIRTFLQTCKKVFGLKDQDLFDPPDLFDVKDFRKVLYTLSKLSKTELAQKTARGFSPPDTRPLTIEHDYYNTLEDLATEFPPFVETQEYDEDEDIYSNLKEMAFENDLDDNQDLYDVVYDGEEDEQIYEHLCIRHQRFSTLLSAYLQTGMPPPTTKRDHCLKELVDTEKNYVEALLMIVNHFSKPLRNVLPPQEREIIFKHIEPLLEVHQAFHSELLKACSKGVPKISEVFIKHKPKFLIYGDFCSNLPQAQDLIDEACKRSELVRNSIEECQTRANDGKFRLRDLLSVPMQRVLKYHLLLKELIKQTDKTDDDRKNLEIALEAMQDLSLYVNEVKRDNEAVDLIEEIQNSIVDLQMPPNISLKDYGRLQKDGDLKVRCHSDNRARPRYIFLFDKVMLMCKSRIVDKLFWGEAYSYKEAIALGEYRIDEQVPSRDQQRKPDKWNFSFTMVQKNQELAYTFFAKTDDMRSKWIEAILLSLDNVQPAAGSTYVMHTFSKPKECDVCGKLLRGVFFQGYQCQETKKAVHKECIGKEKNVPPIPPRTSHVRSLEEYLGIPAPPNERTALKFQSDTVIELLQKSDEWCRGRLRGDEGWFPARSVSDVSSRDHHRKTSYTEHKLNGHHHAITNTTEHGNNLPKFDTSMLTKYPWYVGPMERDCATKKLEGHASGTYMIRESQNPTRAGELSLSICFDSTVRHIKVNKTLEGDFFLADIKFFHSLPELVEWYQENSLVHSFPELKTQLKIPFKESTTAGFSWNLNIVSYAVAIYDYSATATNQLSLRVGDRVAILSKAGGDKGWWKGKILHYGKVGYFPLTYVREEED